MSQPLGLQSLKDWSGGMNSQVVDSLLPTNTVRLIENLDMDIIGALRVRKGITVKGTDVQAGKTFLGLYNFRDSGAGTNNQLIAVTNNVGNTQSVAKYFDGADWQSITGATTFTTGAKMRFATFVDYVFMVNSSHEIKTWNGNPASAVGTTNLTAAPAGEFVATFKDRVYIASTSTYNDRLFYSSYPDATTQALTWTTATDWIDVNPDDGMNITGLANIGTLLLIFKDRAMYRFNGSSLDADAIVNYGAYSQEAIAVRDGVAYFFSPSGIYATNGGYPLKLSTPIQKWIDAIPGASYGSIALCSDAKYVYASIGSVTVDSVAYANVVLVYDINAKVWTVRTYPSAFTRLANYIETDETENVMVGDSAGKVHRLNYGSLDNSTAITYHMKTKKMDFGSLSAVKEFSTMFTFGDKLPGAKTFIQTEDQAPYSPVDSTLRIWWNKVKGMRNRGKYFTFDLSGQSGDGQGMFLGWEIPDLTLEDYE